MKKAQCGECGRDGGYPLYCMRCAEEMLKQSDTPTVVTLPKIPLYTTPPQRKPLTEQEIGAILEDINAFGTRLYTFARAIEAAHGIKEGT